MDLPIVLGIAALAAIVGGMMAARAGISILTVFCLALPFPLSLGGEQGAGNVSTSDLIIAVATVTLLARSGFRLGGAGQAVVAFLVVALLSSWLAGSIKEVRLGLGRMGLVSLVPLVVFANAQDPIRQLRNGLMAYCLSAAVLALICMATFAAGGITASMYTLGIHKNSLGPIFGTAVIATFAAVSTKGQGSLDKRTATTAYLVLAACSIGLLLSLSRSGWAGTLAGLMVVMLLTGRVKPALISAALMLPVLAVVWSQLPKDRVDYATNVSTSSATLKTRFDAIQDVLDAFQSSPVLGVGIGLERQVEPHNVLVLTLGETGVTGLGVFLIMIGSGAATLYAATQRFRRDDPDRILLVAALGAFTLYHVQTLADVYWRRGVGALSWACVGVAVAVNAGAIGFQSVIPTGTSKNSHLPPQPLA